jgi:hypothetical protein
MPSQASAKVEGQLAIGFQWKGVTLLSGISEHGYRGLRFIGNRVDERDAFTASYDPCFASLAKENS